MQKSTKALPDLFVAGTGTNVGKTVVSLLLMHLYAGLGAAPRYVKPFQTGCRTPFDTDSDALFISRYSNGRFTVSPKKSTLCCLPQPKAPWFAAGNQGQLIDPAVVFDTFKKLKKSSEPVIMEAAGGLMVPVNANTLVIDLLQKIAIQPVLVAHAGLGTINHTLLSLDMMKSRGIQPLGVVLSDPGPDATPLQMVQENTEAIERFSKVRVAGVIHPVNDFAKPDSIHLDLLKKLICGEEEI
ncbi:MAG: dethiobiotin synthase [Desulfobacteraceae bacterium]